MGPPPSMPPGSVAMGPPASMVASGGAPMGPPMGMPPMSMPPMGTPDTAGGAPLSMVGQYMPNVARPQMTSVANPPIIAGNIQYEPSYKMQYQKRSTADKSAVKYTGFMPLEGVYEEDTCRIG